MLALCLFLPGLLELRVESCPWRHAIHLDPALRPADRHVQRLHRGRRAPRVGERKGFEGEEDGI